MPELEDYLGRVTPWWRGKPRFIATLTAVLQPFVDANRLIASIPTEFDLDDAIGRQLDTVGEWVGRARYIPLPIANVWFSFDNALLGFDRAPWQGPYDDGVTFSRLDDDTYRRLLRAKILANRWDGTIPGAQAALDAYFVDPQTHVFIQDGAGVANMNAFFAWDDSSRGFDVGTWYQPGQELPTLSNFGMSMTIIVSGKLPTIVDLEVLDQMLIPIKPDGVGCEIAVTSVDGAGVFGFDVDNEFVGGFDSGAWGVSPDKAMSLST